MIGAGIFRVDSEHADRFCEQPIGHHFQFQAAVWFFETSIAVSAISQEI
jgi:hypothetical protein